MQMRRELSDFLSLSLIPSPSSSRVHRLEEARNLIHLGRMEQQALSIRAACLHNRIALRIVAQLGSFAENTHGPVHVNPLDQQVDVGVLGDVQGGDRPACRGRDNVDLRDETQARGEEHWIV